MFRLKQVDSLSFVSLPAPSTAAGKEMGLNNAMQMKKCQLLVSATGAGNHNTSVFLFFSFLIFV